MMWQSLLKLRACPRTPASTVDTNIHRPISVSPRRSSPTTRRFRHERRRSTSYVPNANRRSLQPWPRRRQQTLSYEPTSRILQSQSAWPASRPGRCLRKSERARTGPDKPKLRMRMPLSAAEVIRLLDLKPHPEGGHFRETFRDQLTIEGGRVASTAIYFLLAHRPALPLAPDRCSGDLALPCRRAARASNCGATDRRSMRLTVGPDSQPAHAPRRLSRHAHGSRRKVSANGPSWAARSRLDLNFADLKWPPRVGSRNNPDLARRINHVLAAIGGERRAGDQAALIGGEKHHAARNLFGLAKPAEWNVRQNIFLQHILRARL